MKGYIQKNGIPLMMEGAFVLACIVLPRVYAVYTNFLFYAGLFVYFLIKGDFSFRQWKESLLSGKRFWLDVLWTGALFLAAFGFTNFLEGAFPNAETGMIGLRLDTWGRLLLFMLSTVFLPAIVEETFFRKCLISFENKRWCYLTAAFSIFLFALEHALMPFGILIAAIWALPLTAAYLKTKNMYVPMTAHFVGSLIGNGITVIMTAVRWLA